MTGTKALAASLSLLWWSIVLTSIPVSSGYPEVDLEDFSVDSYVDFIANLRDAIPTVDEKDGIQMLPKHPASDERFILVTLPTDTSPVAFALRTTDLYMLGFQVGKNAWFFKGASKKERKKLFKSAREHKLTYKSTYTTLQKRGGHRKHIKLGVSVLKKAASFLAKNPSNGSKETVKMRSEMLMVVKQMICEAARFKYIERKMKDIGHGQKRPTKKMLYYEWNKKKVRSKILKAKTGHVPKKLRNDVYLI